MSSSYQTSKNHEATIHLVMVFINDNLAKEICETHLAERCNYSTTYFSKLFHKCIGVGFKDYLINKRISLAKEMLIEDKSAKIAVVAYQCGYKDVSYFSRIFKKRTGLTPAIYRQQY